MPDPILLRIMQGAMVHFNAGRLPQAEGLFRQVLRDEPTHPGALHLTGVIAQRGGRYLDAYNFMSKSVAGKPDNAGWYLNLGNVCLAVRKPEEAIAAFLRAGELGADDPRLEWLLGISYAEGRQFAAALPHIQRAIELAPNDPTPHSSMGVIAAHMHGPDAAIPYFQRATDLAPKEAKFPAMLAKALHDCGRTLESRAAYEEAFRRDPNFTPAKLNYAIVLLQLGDMPAGWDAIDARPAVAVELPKAKYKRPLWEGAAASGATILLRAEQGFGDVIQFIRYAPLVAGRGLRINVECHRELKRLIQRVPSIERVYAGGGEPLPDCQFHQLIMSLPKVFRTTVNTIPADVPYLSVDTATRDTWAKRLGPPTGKTRVGLAWAGRPTHGNDANRSMSLADLAPLAAIPHVEFYQLQLGPAAKQAATADFPLIDLTSHLTDFYETAALVSHLDLVIGVDTAIVHLAGALAKPVWTLLPFVAEWRWLEKRTDSPWYPTMRLFRQPKAGDWPAVVAAVGGALAALKAGWTGALDW